MSADAADRIIAQALAGEGYVPDDDDYRRAVEITNALRDAGLLVGPGEVAVARKLLQRVLNHDLLAWHDLRARLDGQP